jgi:hypothetical protein
MTTKIKCVSEQILFMAIAEFQDKHPEFKGIIYPECFQTNGNIFEFQINSLCAESFLKFVQGDFFFGKHFQTETFVDDVMGFKSPESAFEAIDYFNDAVTSVENGISGRLPIDPSVDIVEILTDRGVLYIPEICDCRLGKIFWDFVKGRLDLWCKVVVGDEVFSKNLKY